MLKPATKSKLKLAIETPCTNIKKEKKSKELGHHFLQKKITEEKTSKLLDDRGSFLPREPEFGALSRLFSSSQDDAPSTLLWKLKLRRSVRLGECCSDYPLAAQEIGLASSSKCIYKFKLENK